MKGIKNLNGEPRYITDFGDSHDVTDIKTREVVMKLPRYGVWGYDPAKKKDQVIETGDDLEKLKSEYGVIDENVFRIGLGQK